MGNIHAKDTPKEKIDTPKVEIPEITTTEGQDLTKVEIPNTEGQELTTVEVPEELALSEALDEEFSDSAPTDA